MGKPRALIVDDEPYHLDWLIEFFEIKGYEVVTATNVEQACEALSKEIFKMVIADLNIPAGMGLKAKIANGDPLVREFPGIYAVQYARDRGQWDDQVIIYSVHMSEALSEKAKQLYCTYLPKGRPDVMKEVVAAALMRGIRREARRAAKRAQEPNRPPARVKTDTSNKKKPKPPSGPDRRTKLPRARKRKRTWKAPSLSGRPKR